MTPHSMNKRVATILIVDDNANNLQLLSGILRNEGYQLLLAQDGVSAINLVIQSMPDLILLDIMMPGMNGFEVAKRIRADNKFNSIPIIFISASSDEDSIVRGFECGGQDYISKPFIQRELLARIENQLAIRRNEQNLSQIIKAKDLFFSQMTASLKSPLSQLASFSQMLPAKIEQEDYNRAIEYANIIYDTALSQFEVFENLIEWARIQTGFYTPFFEDVDVSSCVNTIVELFGPMIRNKSLKINSEFETGIVFADELLLHTVLRNILHNAIKFSESQGSIDITVYDKGATVCISIRDYGEGMQTDDAKTLFEDDTDLMTINSDSELKGNGMGLRISKKLVHLMDGNISATAHGSEGIEILISLSSGF